jgi:hypothetical protein
MPAYLCRDFDDTPATRTPWEEKVSPWQLLALRQVRYKGKLPKTFAVAAELLERLQRERQGDQLCFGA